MLINLSTSINTAEASDPVETTKALNKTSRLLRLWSGHLLFSLGVIGMLLPVMPTTVFWIGACICYAKSSPRLYRRLVSHQRFGKPVQNYIEAGMISRKGKLAALFGMALSAAIMLLTAANPTVLAFASFGLAIAAVFVITRPENDRKSDTQ